MDFKLVHSYTKDLVVLYVEDNEALRDSTYQVFNNFFKQIDIAVDGEEGLEKYNSYKAKTGEYYDLIISDINMPRKDGLAMSKDILEINSVQPIIFITAHNEPEYLLDAIKMAITGFLIKPLRLAEFTVVLYRVSKIISDVKKAQNLTNELQGKNEKLKKLMRVISTRVYKNSYDFNTNSYKKLDDITKKEILTLIEDDLLDLKEIYLNMDKMLEDLFLNIDDINFVDEHLINIAKYLELYANRLEKYDFFDCIGESMLDLARLLDERGFVDSSEENEKIFLYMESFFHMLCRWHEDLELVDEKKLNNLNNAIVDEIHHVMGVCGAVELV